MQRHVKKQRRDYNARNLQKRAIFINSSQGLAERGKTTSKRSGLIEEGMAAAMADEEDGFGAAAAGRTPDEFVKVAQKRSCTLHERILDGRLVAAHWREKVRLAILETCSNKRPPHLAVLTVGEHPASTIYVRKKKEACQAVGILSSHIALKKDASEKELLLAIRDVNQSEEIDGILLQLPLPSHLQTSPCIQAIDPKKDVDGFHPLNMGKLLLGEKDGLIPCTPLGIRVLLDHYSIDTRGKNVVIVGRSNLVGKPMAALLMQPGKGGDATVTIAHRQSQNLAEHCQRADILIVAVGSPRLIQPHMVKEGAIVIDVGINMQEKASCSTKTQIVGDVDFLNVAPKCSWITPVPGGIGPMTIAMLLQNTWLAYQQRCP